MYKRSTFAGFSLIELMVALLIVAILMKIAAPYYSAHVKRARRTDAIQTLLAMQLAEESYRASNASYGTLAQVWGGVGTTANGYYSLTITNVAATTYTLTAQSLSTQTSDAENATSCGSLVLTLSAGTTTTTPSACWIMS